MKNLIFLYTLLINICVILGQGANLGKLHWCNTLCLCHDLTNEKMHCFSDLDIYTLLNLDARKKMKLTKIKFRPAEKLMWCTETCLCHKNEGKKQFKCTDKESLGNFIQEKVPSLAHYLEYEVKEPIDKPEEVFEVVDQPEEPEISEESEHERKDRHDKKKSKKHRKNRKKEHSDDHHENGKVLYSGTSAAPVEIPEHQKKPYEDREDTSLYPAIQPTVKVAENNDSAPLGVSQASTGRELPPSATPKQHQHHHNHGSAVVEVPSSGEISQEILDLRDYVEKIKADVSFNQHILLATGAVAVLAILGVLALAIYSCCIGRRSTKHSISKPLRNQALHQEENQSITKVNGDENW